MQKMIRPVVLLLIIPLLMLAACSEYSYAVSGFYAGETVTPEQLAEISAGIAVFITQPGGEGTAAGSRAVESVRNADTAENGDVIVYYTKSGGVWHYNRGCGSLQNSALVISGSIEEAKAAGKARECSICSKGIVLPGAEIADSRATVGHETD